jgi:hypothetical protein
MKARVFRVFKDYNHILVYRIDFPARSHDDTESWEFYKRIVPVMEMRLFNDNDTLEKEILCVLATPEVIKYYSGYDFFNKGILFSFDGNAVDIEFEWVEIEYPYIKKDEFMYSDDMKYAIPKVKFPKISSISHAPLGYYDGDSLARRTELFNYHTSANYGILDTRNIPKDEEDDPY